MPKKLSAVCSRWVTESRVQTVFSYGIFVIPFQKQHCQQTQFRVAEIVSARIAVLLCTETTQKIDRGGAEVDF